MYNIIYYTDYTTIRRTNSTVKRHMLKVKPPEILYPKVIRNFSKLIKSSTNNPYIYIFPTPKPTQTIKNKFLQLSHAITQMFVCGSSNFANMDDHNEPQHTPKRKQNKNPYSSRGLEKFSMVLKELESRRENIIARTGSQGVALIRFMYDNTQEWIPIVVRPKETKTEMEMKRLPPPPPMQEKVEKKERRKGGLLKVRVRDVYFWPLVMVLILVCLVIFGRVFAICCTSICWYLMPTMKERCANKWREIGRRLCDKKLVVASPRAAHGINGEKKG